MVLLEPWFSNRTKSLVKTPKLYLCDTGMAAFLMGIRRVDDVGSSPLVGALWETLVAAELRRRQDAPRRWMGFSLLARPHEGSRLSVSSRWHV